MNLIHPTLPNQHPRLKFKYKTGWTQNILCTSDEHTDSSECALDLLKADYDLAKETGAYIASFGDFFDVINSREDKRRSAGSMRDENKVDAYVDSVIDFGLKHFGKYADQFLMFSRGNHEIKLIKLCGTDIMRRFVDELNRLRSPGLPEIYLGGYGGWLRVLFERDSGQGCSRQSCNIKFFHGAGCAAEVTKGTMEVQRMAAAIDGADIVVTGHTHNGWQIPHVQETLNDAGVAQFKPRLHCKLSGYKVDYRLDGAGTWAVQKGFKPSPIGGAWITFHAPNNHKILWTARPTDVDYSRVA